MSLQLYPQHRHKGFAAPGGEDTVGATPFPTRGRPCDSCQYFISLVMCSDVTESGAWGMPQATASPPPPGQGQARPGQMVAMGSCKAKAVEGKGNGKEKRQKEKESGFVV